MPVAMTKQRKVQNTQDEWTFGQPFCGWLSWMVTITRTLKAQNFGYFTYWYHRWPQCMVAIVKSKHFCSFPNWSQSNRCQLPKPSNINLQTLSKVGSHIGCQPLSKITKWSWNPKNMYHRVTLSFTDIHTVKFPVHWTAVLDISHWKISQK